SPRRYPLPVGNNKMPPMRLSESLDRAAGAVVVWLALAGVLSAQPEPPRPGTLIGEEKRTRDELEVADRLAGEKRYDEAVRRYRQILAESGDALVSLEPT